MAKGADAAREIVRRIQRTYPDASYALEWNNPFQLLVGTMLAAQSTDATVNRVTADLFRTYPDARAFAAADPEALGEAIRPCGIHQVKAKALIGAATMIVEKFGGSVPRTMDEMLELPGVKRKSANVVLNCAYKVASGIIVDVHVQRLAQRIGLSTSETPEAIEKDLMKLVPEDDWTTFGPALILHGRAVCVAKAPRCDGCVLDDSCMKVGVGDAPAGKPAKPAKRRPK